MGEWAIGLGALLGAAGVAFGWRERARAAAERERAAASERAREIATDAAQAQRRRIDLFADGLAVAIVILDERSAVRYANRQARRIFAEDILGKSLLAATLSPEIEGIVRESARAHDPVEREVALGAPRERIFLAKCWSPGDAGPATGDQTYLSLIEITDLRRLERVRRDFVANVSHELRTPLTIIRAYAETLQEDDDPDLRARYLERMIAEVDRLTAMSQDLLILSASESAPIRKAECDFAAVVRDAVHELEGRAADRGQTVAFTGESVLRMEANAAQMKQVVLNLVENAIKYAKESGEAPVPAIEVSLARDEEGAILTVRDHGLGIASEHLDRIFERFYRVDRARSRAGGGTGLGLAIVRHIVEVHGGTVEVESALNIGTTFRVRLPLGNEPPG